MLKRPAKKNKHFISSKKSAYKPTSRPWNCHFIAKDARPVIFRSSRKYSPVMLDRKTIATQYAVTVEQFILCIISAFAGSAITKHLTSVPRGLESGAKG